MPDKKYAWGAGLWRQAQKVKLERDGTLRAPVEVTRDDGIRIGDPPFEVTSKASAKKAGSGPRRGLLDRIRQFWRRF